MFKDIHKIIFGVIVIAVQLIIVGCDGSSEVSHKLSFAESIIEERPDSSLIILQSVDTEDLTSKAQKAKYALLMSLAKHKNYIDETDDSLISIAADYYIPQRDLRYAIMSEFLLARVLYNAGRYDESIMSALDAEEMASDTYPLWNASSGFSIKAISIILKMKPKGVYTKRQRLFDKIKSNTSIDPIISLK